MNTKIKNTGTAILWMLVLVLSNLNAQESNRESGMRIISDEVVINSSPAEAWETLTAFGNVSDFLSTIDEGSALNGSLDLAVLGAERESIIPKGIHNIIQKERIINLLKGLIIPTKYMNQRIFQ